MYRFDAQEPPKNPPRTPQKPLSGALFGPILPPEHTQNASERVPGSRQVIFSKFARRLGGSYILDIDTGPAQQQKCASRATRKPIWATFPDKRGAPQNINEEGGCAQKGGGWSPPPGGSGQGIREAPGSPTGGIKGGSQNRSHTPDDPQRGVGGYHVIYHILI